MLAHVNPLTILLAVAFLFGGVVGSFANVCIYRIPAGISIAFPASRCPVCLVPIRWYQNVPILSYLFLRGRCAACGGKIPVRYPLVEALCGFLFALVLYHFGFQPATLVYLVFCWTLVVITFIDLDHQIIPNVLSLPGSAIGFLCSFAVPWLSWSDSLLGILLGGGSLYLIAAGYQLLTGKEGMGMGDVKLLAMIGAFLGWQAVLPVVFFASLLGSLVGVPLMIVRRADSKLAIPFGPFLALGALIYLFWGTAMIGWYMGFFH
jgi:leader peptidase (prepilin peptidase)/N-methyltransferase